MAIDLGPICQVVGEVGNDKIAIFSNKINVIESKMNKFNWKINF